MTIGVSHANNRHSSTHQSLCLCKHNGFWRLGVIIARHYDILTVRIYSSSTDSVVVDVSANDTMHLTKDNMQKYMDKPYE